MGKHEISEDMINKANALGGLGITHNNRGANKPATSVSWFEAARFVNWLNTSQGHHAAYKFDNANNFQLWAVDDDGYDSHNLFRNSRARYFLPSTDEWYKAAYYDPINEVYYDFPTGSNLAPTAVAGGMSANTAVYGQPGTQGPADIELAGGSSPFGTIGQGGNVFEWEETQFDGLNNSNGASGRGVRGGEWSNGSVYLRSTVRSDVNPTRQDLTGIGFRVASVAVPEPSFALPVFLCLAVYLAAGRSRELAVPLDYANSPLH